MAKTDLHNLSTEELVSKLEEAQVAYFDWQEAVRSGKESNSGKLSKLRRDIARIKTVLQEKEQEKTA